MTHVVDWLGGLNLTWEHRDQRPTALVHTRLEDCSHAGYQGLGWRKNKCDTTRGLLMGTEGHHQGSRLHLMGDRGAPPGV